MKDFTRKMFNYNTDTDTYLILQIFPTVLRFPLYPHFTVMIYRLKIFYSVPFSLTILVFFPFIFVVFIFSCSHFIFPLLASVFFSMFLFFQINPRSISEPPVLPLLRIFSRVNSMCVSPVCHDYCSSRTSSHHKYHKYLPLHAR